MEHLRDPSPAFACRVRGHTVPTEDGRIVRLQHELNPPALQREIKKLRKLFGDDSQTIEQLYSVHNGMTLYSDKNRSALEFFSIAELGKRNKEWREDFSDWMKDELFDFQRSGVAFGTVVLSDNYFVLWNGAVYFSDTDGGDDTPVAPHISDFFELIAAEPAKFLQQYGGGFVSYAPPPGWVPEEYIAQIE